MKFLTALLSIYIFALNLAPCEDNNTFDNNIKTEISHTHDNEHQHQETDLCSPFCSCQCCHIHATNFKFVHFTVTFSDISTDVFYYFKGLEKDFNNLILQPPQV